MTKHVQQSFCQENCAQNCGLRDISRVLLGGLRLLGCLMINLLSRDETYHYFKYKVLNLTNLQINNILYTKFSDVNYINNNNGQI